MYRSNSLAILIGLLGPVLGMTWHRVPQDGRIPTARSNGGREAAQARFKCARTIEDQASQACLEASSIPRFGTLYPLGPELNIDPAGRVGIGTTSPSSLLTVAGRIETTSGGIVFPDGSLQSTAAIWTTQKRTPMQIAMLRFYDVNEAGHSFGLGAGADGAYGVAFDGAHLWVTNFNSSTLSKIRASDGSVILTVATQANPRGIVFDGTSVWVANWGANRVTRHLASNGMWVSDIAVGQQPFGIAYDGTHVWVANAGDGTVCRINVISSATSTHTVGQAPWGVAADGSHLWVANSEDNTVTKLSLDGVPEGTFPTGTRPYGLAVDGDSVWITNFDDDTVTRLLISNGQNLGTYAVGDRPVGITFDGTTMWVANFGDDTVTRLRASDGANLGTHATGAGPQFLAFDRSNVWVANFTSDDLGKL